MVRSTIITCIATEAFTQTVTVQEHSALAPVTIHSKDTLTGAGAERCLTVRDDSIGPVALRSRSALGQLTVLVYSHVQSALAPLSIISSPSTPVEGISPVTEDV